jgi:DNA-binding transcriptional ArsR family regulator
MSEKSVLVSLGDERLKEISEVISNKTCNKILDFLSEKEATVSDISKELNIPINTTDYNIKKLIKAGLIEKKSHFWSVKGKKMPSYTISNKRIIISPKKSKSVTSLILALGLTGFIALLIRQFSQIKTQNEEVRLTQSFDAVAPKIVELSSESAISGLASWEWFLIGAWLAIVFFFIISSIIERRVKNE